MHPVAEIRALIVDDEPLARRGIRQLLAEHADVVVVGECRNGREAVRSLATLKPDLVFLDIEMPGLDGLGVVRIHGAEHMPATIFVTAHDEFAVAAFEAHALDYLVKPLSTQRFRAALARVRDQLRVKDAVALAGRLAALLASHGARTGRAGGAARASGGEGPPIAVPTASGMMLLDAADIEWVEAQGDHTVVHAGAAAHQVRQSLGALERRLGPTQFVRLHRSVLVRLDLVRALDAPDRRRDAAVVLRDGTRLPVSRRRLAALRALLRGVSGRT
jgi:two-component system LytT family response regulator